MAPRDLKEACVREALKIIESKGVENLSLRAVARRLQVSHQAPYKHFPSKDHILAEIIRRGFETFAEYLEADEMTGDPLANLGILGRAYLKFALDYPLYYRLMFATPHPNPKKHEAMAARSLAAFDILRSRVGLLNESTGADMNIDEEALFIWSTIHGLASILSWQHSTGLPIAAEDREAHITHVLRRVGHGLSADIPPAALKKLKENRSR